MNAKKTILEQGTEAIREKTGLQIVFKPHGKAGGEQYNLVIQNRDTLFFLEYNQYVPTYMVDKITRKTTPAQPIMIIAERIAEPAREEMRKKGIAYLEANGNAFIHTADTMLFIDGNKPIKTTKPVTNRAFTKTGLKVVFHLLNDPTAIRRTYRELARETNVALGNIKYIIDGLHEAGYILPINRREIALKNKRALLDRWIAGYRETLKPDLFIKQCRMANEAQRNNWADVQIRDLDMQWGGQAAAELMTNYLTAQELTLYTKGFTAMQGNRLGLIPDNNGDILLYEKFWYEPADIQALAPPLLVYADLLITDDPRCIETAQLLYNTHVIHTIEAD